MDNITFTQPSGSVPAQARFSTKGGKLSNTNATKEEMQHDLAKFVVGWLGWITAGIVVVLTLAFSLPDEKFKLLIPGLLSVISGTVGYIAGHTSRGNK